MIFSLTVRFNFSQLTLDATWQTPRGFSLCLVLAMSGWSVKTRRAPSRHCRDARVYGHTTTAMHEMNNPPPPFFFSSHTCCLFVCRREQIVVKGVMTAEDASEAVRQGVDAIWISNHGARQLDTTPATIEVLPEVGDVHERILGAHDEMFDLTAEARLFFLGGILCT